MKIVLAPDKFKGSMTAQEAAEIEKQAFLSVIPGCQILCVPLADGGEGTVKALTAANGGTLHTACVHDPLFRMTKAEFGLSGKTAFLEMAEASGMALLQKEELDPLKTSTFGTGELIKKALDCGVDDIIIGIGGSATVDGGTGMAEALGYVFLDAQGKTITGLCGSKLASISAIDAAGADPRLKNCRIRIASDVTNPLLGANGAVAVFAPQKGATPGMLPLLEEGLAHLYSCLKKQQMIGETLPGDGAAGGLGLGLRAFCGASSESGARLAIRAVRLEEKIADADWVVTGEGCSDAQTDNGKLCSEIAALCRKKGVPCALLSGKIMGTAAPAFAKMQATVSADTPFESIRERTKELLYEAACALARELLKESRIK